MTEFILPLYYDLNNKGDIKKLTNFYKLDYHEKQMDELEKLKIENETLRKEVEKLRTIKVNQKKGMIKMASKGNLMSRAPFGYKIEDKKLIPADNYLEIEEIFEEFLNENISLSKLARKHNLSVNGLKKILKNFTYIGKVKFNNQTYPGEHKQIISSTLFNHVQNKIEKLGIK